MTLKETLREKLFGLESNQMLVVPLHQRSTITVEIADLRQFHDLSFTTKVDKTRNELVVKRVA